MQGRASTWLVAGSAVAGSIAAVLAVRAWLAVARRSLRIASFAWRAARLQLHRRCPDCAERVRSEARVCRHCGYRFRGALIRQ